MADFTLPRSIELLPGASEHLGISVVSDASPMAMSRALLDDGMLTCKLLMDLLHMPDLLQLRTTSRAGRALVREHDPACHPTHRAVCTCRYARQLLAVTSAFHRCSYVCLHTDKTWSVADIAVASIVNNVEIYIGDGTCDVDGLVTEAARRLKLHSVHVAKCVKHDDLWSHLRAVKRADIALPKNYMFNTNNMSSMKQLRRLSLCGPGDRSSEWGNLRMTSVAPISAQLEQLSLRCLNSDDDLWTFEGFHQLKELELVHVHPGRIRLSGLGSTLESLSITARSMSGSVIGTITVGGIRPTQRSGVYSDWTDTNDAPLKVFSKLKKLYLRCYRSVAWRQLAQLPPSLVDVRLEQMPLLACADIGKAKAWGQLQSLSIDETDSEALSASDLHHLSCLRSFYAGCLTFRPAALTALSGLESLFAMASYADLRPQGVCDKLKEIGPADLDNPKASRLWSPVETSMLLITKPSLHTLWWYASLPDFSTCYELIRVGLLTWAEPTTRLIVTCTDTPDGVDVQEADVTVPESCRQLQAGMEDRGYGSTVLYWKISVVKRA